MKSKDGKNKKGRVRIMSRGTCLEEEVGLGRRQGTLKFRVNGCEKGQLGSAKGKELSWGPILSNKLKFTPSHSKCNLYALQRR